MSTKDKKQAKCLAKKCYVSKENKQVSEHMKCAGCPQLKRLTFGGDV